MGSAGLPASLSTQLGVAGDVGGITAESLLRHAALEGKRSIGENTAGEADGKLINGTAQNPTLVYAQNIGGVARSEEYMIELARKMGVYIPDDVMIKFVNPSLLQNSVGAQAEYGQIGKYLGSDPSRIMTWESMIHEKTGKIPVRLSEALLSSDEAALAHVAHENFELAKFEEAGRWTQKMFVQQTAAPVDGGAAK